MRTLIRSLVLTALLSTTVLLSACTELPDVTQSQHSQPVGEIYGSRTVGQTFVSRVDGLNRVDVLLATYARRNTHPVTFHLRSNPSSQSDIATLTIEAETVKDNTYRAFRFPPLTNSKGSPYYFFLESPSSTPGDAITIWHSPNDTYADGQVYIKGEPRDGDLAFKTYYSYGVGSIVKDAYLAIKTNIVPIFLMILLCLLPGYVLLQLLAPALSARFDLPQRLILSLGLSLALIPLLLLCYTLLGLKLDKGQAMGILACFGALGLANALNQIRRRGFPKVANLDPAYLLLFIILLLSLLVRFLSVKDVLAPPGSDSYHHALITQLIAERGRIPDSYEPYAPIGSFTYHFSFHSLVVFYHWLSDTDVARSVLIIGQLLNGLIPLSVFFCAVRFTKSNTIGLLSALIVGLLSVFPAYYVNWGRWTQGAGLVLLPIILTLTIECLEREKRDAKALLVTSIVLSGLFLTHYRILIFYLAFMAVYLVYVLFCSTFGPCTVRPGHVRGVDQENSSQIVEVLLRFLTIGLLALVLTSPWIWRLFHSPALGKLTKTSIRPESSFFSLARLGDACSFYSNYPLLALSVLGILWGLLRREKLIILLSLWVGVLLLFSNPYWLDLPGAGFVDYVTIVTSLFFPASIAIGFLGDRLWEALGKKIPKAGLLAGLLIVAIALGGASRMFTILNSQSVYVQEADKVALEWIVKNTTSEAKFLVSSLIYDRAVNLVMGLDAGYWIPLFTGRSTTVPPLIYLNERLTQKDYAAKVAALSDASRSPTTEEALRLFKESGVSHLYFGKGCAGIDLENLIDDPHYRTVYNHQGVRIFEIDYEGAMTKP